MAKAQVTETVVRTRTTILELTDEEAVVLRAIVGNISGPSGGLRRHTRQIYEALNNVGYEYFKDDRVRNLSDYINPSITLPETFNG